MNNSNDKETYLCRRFSAPEVLKVWCWCHHPEFVLELGEGIRRASF